MSATQQLKRLPIVRADFERLLTNSRLKATRRCLREAKYAYEDGYRALAQSENLHLGDLVHKGLEAWWKAATDSERLPAAEVALDAHRAGMDPFMWAKARVMVVAYHYRWIDEMPKYEVLGVEVEFRAKLRNPETGSSSTVWMLGGKIDAIVREVATGRVLIVEHKTSSEDCSPGTDYWKRLRLDAQIGIYYSGARSLGHDVEGCLYDVLRKPALRPLQANKSRKDPETPEAYGERCAAAMAEEIGAYFSRGEVVRLDSEMTELEYDLWQQAATLREAQRTNRWPKNPDACIRFGYECPFWGVCVGEVSLDDPLYFRKLDFVHPELSPVGSPANEEQNNAASTTESTAA